MRPGRDIKARTKRSMRSNVRYTSEQPRQEARISKPRHKSEHMLAKFIGCSPRREACSPRKVNRREACTPRKRKA
ncbi:hypothetical protein V6N13_038674 [Hibiscus sabdariffa]